MKKHFTLGNRLVSLLVILCFTASLVPVIASAESSGKPTDLTPLYADDFSDGVLSGNIDTYRFFDGDPADTLTESDGKLTFERKKWIWYTDSSYGEPAVKLYANEDHSGVSGKVFTEFNLSKTREVVRLRFCDSSGNYITQISWEGSDFSFGWRDSSMGSKSKSISISSSDTVKISLYCDVSSQRPRFYMWINDELQVNGGFSATDLSAADFSMIQVYTLLYSGYGKAGTFTVSDFGIYSLNSDEGLLPEVDLEDEQTVDADLSWLTGDMLLCAPLAGGYLIDSLAIDNFTRGANGSYISWSISDESIIAPDGTLTRPDSDTEVTLTASVKCGTVTKEKTFTYKVAGKNNNISGLPGDITPIYYDNFADGKIDANIKTSGFCTDKPADTLTEADSKLTFTRRQNISADDENFGKPSVTFFAKEDESVLSGKLLTEYIISKTCSVVGMTIGDNNGGLLTDIIWSGNSFNVKYRSNNLEPKTKTVYVDSDSTVKISVYSDLGGQDPVYSLWINNEKKIDNAVCASSFQNGGISSLKLSTYIYGSYGHTGSYSIDNVGIYSVADSFTDEKGGETSDDEDLSEKIVDEDLEAITDDIILSVPLTEEGYLADPLDIDAITSGANGSDISWESSREDIIAPNGKLTRPLYDTDVTVTAVAAFGSVTKEKSFTYKVAGTSTDIDGMRSDIFPIYYDDFSDGEINEAIATRNIKNTDSVFEANGKLTLRTTSWASHEPAIMLYKDLNHNALSGEFVMEFTLSKTCDVVRMRTINSNWNYLNQIYWVKDSFNIYYRDESMSSQELTLNIPADQKAKVTIYTDITGSTPKFTMWVNNKKVLEDAYSCTNMSPASIQWIQIYSVNHGSYGETGDTIIDNFGYYNIMPEMTDAERVKADYDALTDASLIKTTTPLVGCAFEDLKLSSYGQNGSRITWTSSHEEYVSTSGKVTRPESENVPVTLTATITSGSETLVKTFEVTILGNHVEIGDVPTVETMITENTFDSPDTPNLITSNLTGGGSVEISDGVLNLIKTGSGTSQVGASVYTGADSATSATGVIGLEFDIEREKASAVQIRSMDANGNLYYSMAWGSTGMSAYYSNDPATQGTQSGVWMGSGNKIHVNMMFDTANSTYWLWVNGQAAVVEKYSRSVGVGAICYTMFYLESINNVKIDNYKIYEAIPPKALRLKFDDSAFDEDDILNEQPQAGNIISSSLNLPTLLRYGTAVNWQSSDPDIINPATGEVTRPIDAAQNPLVTLTAYMENSGITATRKYSYYVLRDFSDKSNLQQQEAMDIKHSYLTSEDPNAIKMSLNLMDKGLYGSDIRWSSSNTSVITNSGRVIRPHFDEPDATVTLTAAIGSYKKELTFTVLADDPPKDPMHTSDEEFFGVWDGTSYIKGPQLDYSNTQLSAVMECAKAGDYAGAKQALYEYFKVRNVASPIALGTRHSGWVDARADGLFELSEEAAYWKGLLTITSDDYEAHTVSIYKPSAISKIKCKTFELIARYNECTSAFVLGTDADNPNMAPKLELTVNGAVRSYTATGTATIRAGKYSREHIGDNKELQAKMFGSFLGDETYRILLSFDLSDIEATDTISAAQLTVYAKKSSPSADNKQLWIIDNKGKEWNEKTVYWDSLNFTVHNYNGLVGGTDWKGARSSDIEFAYQMPRFMHARSTMTEYKYTGNEKYAYSLLGQVMDIITDTGNKTPYPRSLDAALRMHQWVPLINTFKDSPYFTPEFATAFMKYMYRQFEYFPTRKEATGNWRDYEQLAVLYATSAYPELANSASTKETCIWSWQNAFNKSYMTDGSYIEDTLGYSASSFAMYRDFKKACVDSGTTLPTEFDETLRKAAYYMVLTYGADGYALQYGDAGGGQKSGSSYGEVADWYNDNEFRYIDSLGKVGIEPSWTSYQFPEGRYTMMRSDWRKGAIYLHTSVRGGGGHGHADDNSIILIGNGKRLLVDAGKLSYNSYDPSRMYAQSTQGHNTVVINDTSQRTSWTGSEYTVRGNINRWATNSAFDFLSQTTISYAEHDHTRNILFIKDGLFVVSDLMEPHDKTKENNYKQYWHMAPEANIKADDEHNILSSAYEDGKNLILASADDVSAWLEDGYYDTSDGTPVANKAGIFEKSVTGDATLDTVMYVTDFKDAKVSAERIDTGKPTSDVTALKINVFENNTPETYYYMYNHKYDGSQKITFADYTTDARVALVGTGKNGALTSMVMTDGTFISENGKDILNAEDGTTDISAKLTSSKLTLVSSDSHLSPGSIAAAASGIKTVVYNGEAKAFEESDGIIKVGSGNASEDRPQDSNKNDGIMERPSSGGSGGAGGSGGGVIPTDPQTPDTKLPFTDIDGHWAQGYITGLYSGGFVNGNPDGTYKPDNPISRCEFAAIAVRIIGAASAAYEGGFEDISADDWFASDVQTAVNLGIISKDSLFRPHDNITRQEMCKILTLCSKYLGRAETEAAPLTFDDTSKLSSWAVEYAQYAVANGIINGKPGNVFDPLGNATRAETAAVFSRILE